MTLAELQKIIAFGENLVSEFKHKINFPEKIAREIVAFANTKGGRLFIGVDDNKTIFGLKNSEEEVFALQNVCKNFIKHPPAYSITKIRINEKKDVIVMDVQESTDKPNYAFEKIGQNLGTVYVRVHDKSVQASPEVIKILSLKSKGQFPKIGFGDIEKKIVQLIDSKGYTTIKTIEEALLISNLSASEKLINMTLAGILEVIPFEDFQDQYRIKN